MPLKIDIGEIMANVQEKQRISNKEKGGIIIHNILKNRQTIKRNINTILVYMFKDPYGMVVDARDYGKPGEKRETQDPIYQLQRERGNEIITALSEGVKTVFLDTNGELLEAFHIDNISNIKGSSAYFRRELGGSVPFMEEYSLRDIIDDREKVLLWPETVQEEKFLKRKLGIQTVSLIENEGLKAANSRGFTSQQTIEGIEYNGLPSGDFFIKSLDKSVFNSAVVKSEKERKELIRDRSFFSYIRRSGKNNVITSTPIDIKVESNRKKEYRCFVINGKLANISRYNEYDSFETPEGVKDLAEDFIDFYRDSFSTYVVDIAEIYLDGKTQYAVIELNALTNCGRYFGNKFSDILDLLN